MRKIILISLFTFSFSIFTFFCGAQNRSPRFGVVPNDDNTGRTLTYFYYTPKDTAGADTAKFTPHGFETFVQPSDSIKDSLVVNAYTTRSNICDKIEFQCVGADSNSSNKSVTFNKGFKGPHTRISVLSKKAYHITFIFDGVAWRETAYTAQN